MTTETTLVRPQDVTIGLLSGGQGHRLGGQDKGWYEIHGRPLIAYTLERLATQADDLRISANRSYARYAALGWPVVGDDRDGYDGPLAGIAALLQATDRPFMLFCPVDTPRLPSDLLVRLAQAMRPDIDIVAARSPSGVHPLHALVRATAGHDLSKRLAVGQRRVTAWQAACRLCHMDWSEDAPFDNINTPADAARIADLLLAH